MKKRSGNIKAIFLAGMLGLSITFAPQITGQATELVVRETVEQEAASGRIIIGVEGVDLTSAQKDLIDRINEVRKAACEDGITPDPRDKSRMLQPSDYVEMKLGVNCTKAAVVRAAEAAINLSHTRPNGTSCFQVHQYYNASNYSSGENLSWNYIKGSSIEGWIGERDAYLGKSSGQTGHYETLINPKFKYTGMSTFNPVNDTVSYDWACTAGAYAASDVAISSYAPAQDETVIQKIEVPVSAVTQMDISGNAMLQVGETDTLQLLAQISFPNGVRPNTTMDCPVYDGVEWTSSDTSVLSISEDGKLSVKKTGTVTVTAAIGTGEERQEAAREFVVEPSGVTVTGAENPEMITVESGEKPVLPKTVNASLSNGSKVALNVTWEDYDEENLATEFKSSEFDIAGTAFGYPVTQRVHVNAVKITKTYTKPATVTTDSGVEPEYPKAFVVLSNGMQYIDLQVKWDQESSGYYKNRDGGTFELKGETAYGFETDEGTVHFPVTAGLIVNPATITEVVFDEEKLVTQSGVEPIYPKATVKWSNGDTEQEDITWTKSEAFLSAYKKREGGTYTVEGSCRGKNTTVTVEVLPAKVTAVSFDDREIHVENGTCPVLPKQADVTWSNGDKEQALISWDDIPEEKYNNLTGGSFEVKGTVAGQTVKVSCVAAAPVIQKVKACEPVETVEGVQPELPGQAQVTWNNGQITAEQIVWEEVAESAYSTPDESFTVWGSLKNYADTDRTVQITVSVREKSLKSLKWKQDGAKNPTGTDCYDRYDWSQIDGTVIAQFDNGTEEILGLKDERLVVSGYEENGRTDTSEGNEGTTGNGGTDEGRPETPAGTTESLSGGASESQTGNKGATTGTTESQTGDKGATTGTTESRSGNKGATTGTTESQTGSKGATTGTTESQTGDKGATTGTTESRSGNKGATTGTTESQTGSKGATMGTTESQTGIKGSSVATTTELNDKITEEKTQAMRPGSISVSKVTAKKRGFTVRWKKGAADVTGYQLQYSTNKRFKTGRKTILIKKRDTVSKTIRKLKTKKKYYIRIRTLRVSAGEKYYSDWSKVKTVKTK